MSEEFQEIGHAGGQLTIKTFTDAQGRRFWQETYTHMRPTQVVVSAVWVMPKDGVPVPWIRAGEKTKPFPGSGRVSLVSDSEGRFGHNCPSCDQYWRSESSHPNVCPYCGTRAASHEFLSHAQRRFALEFCRLLGETREKPDGTHAIDFDAIADAVGKEEKPPFYMSEKSQQKKFTCEACGEFNDILGRVGFCCSCGTRNDLAEFAKDKIPELRQRLNDKVAPEDCVRAAVSAFDSFATQYAKQLAEHVPMVEHRRKRLAEQPFHKPKEFKETLTNWFAIDVSSGIKDDDWEFVRRMFFRRHVYEHNLGVVDQEYLDASGDSTVVLNQQIRETQDTAHRLLGLLVKMANNLHDGFHELLPPLAEPIKEFEAKKARIEAYAKSRT